MSSVRCAALAALACAALWSAAATAQVYRIVGPDGRVTFSDRPPAEGKAQPAPGVAVGGGANGAAAGNLPFELRTVASRYPVTLYTGPECGPCVSARNYLTVRGVPFSERTVTTQEDIDALKSLAGKPVLPFATIGGQHLEGFSEATWSQYLDAAGYPKVSQLPRGYRNPPATPLVAVQQPAPRTSAPAQAQAAPQPAAPTASDEPPPSNPAGIRF